MLPGDVVLVRRASGLFDRLVQFGTVSPYFHSAMVVDTGRVIEADFHGVQYTTLYTYKFSGDLWVPQGVTDAQRAKAVAFCEARLGKPYGWKDVLEDLGRIAFHIPFGYNWVHWSHFDCSCLIAAAWFNAGRPLTRTPIPTPADLGWSEILLPDSTVATP
jgi:uncharacterized protein YycO